MKWLMRKRLNRALSRRVKNGDIAPEDAHFIKPKCITRSIDLRCEEGGGIRPARPRRAEVGVLAYIQNLTNKHGLYLTDAAEQAWGRFQDRLAFLRSGPARRSLRLEPHREDNIPNKFQEWHIDVTDRGVEGIHYDLYRLCDVTGVDEVLQAVVASQKVTAECLTDAMQQVEAYQLHEFSFVCHCATDVSVACCLLLAALACPKACVHLTTSRTRTAAAKADLPPSLCSE